MITLILMSPVILSFYPHKDTKRNQRTKKWGCPGLRKQNQAQVWKETIQKPSYGKEVRKWDLKKAKKQSQKFKLVSFFRNVYI